MKDGKFEQAGSYKFVKMDSAAWNSFKLDERTFLNQSQEVRDCMELLIITVTKHGMFLCERNVRLWVKYGGRCVDRPKIVEVNSVRVFSI
jgi:hypothetical protein